MGCGASRDYSADIQRLDQCQSLINEVLSLQAAVIREKPDHDMYDNTEFTMWSSKVQRLVLLLRGESEAKMKDLKRSKRQVTLAADELENLVKWIDKAKYEMAKTNNVWLKDEELSFIQTMKTSFIQEVNKMRKYKANLNKPQPEPQPDPNMAAYVAAQQAASQQAAQIAAMMAAAQHAAASSAGSPTTPAAAPAAAAEPHKPEEAKKVE